MLKLIHLVRFYQKEGARTSQTTPKNSKAVSKEIKGLKGGELDAKGLRGELAKSFGGDKRGQVDGLPPTAASPKSVDKPTIKA